MIKETKCKDCGLTLYTIEGKFAKKKDGTVMDFLQKYEDMDGTIEHFNKCEIGRAKYEAKKAQEKLQKIQNKVMEPTTAQKATLESAKLAETNTAKNGLKTAEQKAQEYIDKYGINADNPYGQTSNAEVVYPKKEKSAEPPTTTTTTTITKGKEVPQQFEVKEIISFEQLTSQQLERIERKINLVIKHFKIEEGAQQ